MPRLLVTFDSNSAAYVTEFGNLTVASGNPAPCLDGGTGSSTRARIRVDLPYISIVRSVGADWIRRQAQGQNGRLQIRLCDISDNELLYTDHVIDTQPGFIW